MDIFFTATTIIHLCSISLDRYLALRRPFGHSRAIPKILHSLLLRILMSWLVPFFIAGPLFLFALQQQEQERKNGVHANASEYRTKTAHGDVTKYVNGSDQEWPNRSESYKGCGPNDPGFVLTAIAVTFVLPLAIMATTYVLTVKTLRQHMKQVKSIKLYATRARCTAQIEQIPELRRENSTGIVGVARQYKRLLRHASEKITAKTSDFKAAVLGEPIRVDRFRLSVRTSCQRESERRCASITISDRRTETSDPPCFQKPSNSSSFNGNADIEERANLAQSNRLCVKINLSPGTSEQEECEIKFPASHEFGLTTTSRRTNVTTTHSTTMDRIHSGKRAVRVIGVLFCLFVTCYLPFFIVYVINVVCVACETWTNLVIPYLEWLGYLSSMLNPVVYHSFNSTFRRTFRRMFYCACRSTQEQHLAIWSRRL
ncbi:hypothetical protein P879_00813 [Paragonimus westermani]|uniref:G-protein coupled receptors family 1 profile domain-containing protein n=1 Tax=Paragonimus westermani TaxID=34504 RepID=A0A8T0DWI0_9TREM|nr:hypothetical protein P879_00813 [Paragonimus westermani]